MCVGGGVMPWFAATLHRRKKAIGCNAKEGLSYCLPLSGLGGNFFQCQPFKIVRAGERDREG